MSYYTQSPHSSMLMERLFTLSQFWGTHHETGSSAKSWGNWQRTLPIPMRTNCGPANSNSSG